MRLKRLAAATLTAATITGTVLVMGTPTAGAAPGYSGFLSTAVGCQTPVLQQIQSCTKQQRFSSNPPLPLLFDPAATTIVVLGYGLLPGGGMRPTLITRLQTARDLALRYPGAPIIVTGGNPRGGRTEAQAMKTWLAQSGVPPWRITAENAARDTVGNANNSWAIACGRHTTGLVVVTSPDHIKRALVNFRTAVGGRVPVIGVVPR
ncbi:YdcF family protein [Jongsikchunia kroppenstedtii]|uniref:YdcF family protein n=1 Tax=Jongsikchunia kroppenstedtii TaxID=1121721 RepID=UPI00037E4F63|nr:YdcF family protein [Jongsikchunia kroppenstedtii]